MFFNIIDNQYHRQQPSPKVRGGISFLASMQAGFTPTDLWFVPATKVTRKTVLRNLVVSSNCLKARCGCMHRGASQSQPVVTSAMVFFSPKKQPCKGRTCQPLTMAVTLPRAGSQRYRSSAVRGGNGATPHREAVCNRSPVWGCGHFS